MTLPARLIQAAGWLLLMPVLVLVVVPVLAGTFFVKWARGDR